MINISDLNICQNKENEVFSLVSVGGYWCGWFIDITKL